MKHIQTLKRFNAWCRGEEVIDLPSPQDITEAIEALIEDNTSLQLSRTEWKAEAAMWKEEVLSPKLMDHHRN